MKLVRRHDQIDLTQSDRKHRVFFVGDHFWNQVNRPVTRGFQGQFTKEHGKWTFVLVNDVSPEFCAEIPFVSAFVRRRRERLEKAAHAATLARQKRPGLGKPPTIH